MQTSFLTHSLINLIFSIVNMLSQLNPLHFIVMFPFGEIGSVYSVSLNIELFGVYPFSTVSIKNYISICPLCFMPALRSKKCTGNYLFGNTRGVQYVMETAQYTPKFYIYTPNNYFHKNVCFLAE